MKLSKILYSSALIAVAGGTFCLGRLSRQEEIDQHADAITMYQYGLSMRDATIEMALGQKDGSNKDVMAKVSERLRDGSFKNPNNPYFGSKVAQSYIDTLKDMHSNQTVLQAKLKQQQDIER